MAKSTPPIGVATSARRCASRRGCKPWRLWTVRSCWRSGRHRRSSTWARSVCPPRRTTGSTRCARATRTRTSGHPLLGGRVRSALPITQFEAEINLWSVPYLADHRIHGSAVLPAAAYVEMALAAAAKVLGAGAQRIEDLKLEQVLF